MNELPESWTTAPLSAISTDVPQRIPGETETFTYIDIGSVDRDTKAITTPQVLLGKDAPSRARKQVAKGDTLVSMTRPNLNAVALVPPSLDGQIASTGFDVLRPLDGIDPRWLAYLVRTEKFVSAMSELVQGALYPAVRTKDVRAYVAPVAPCAEQTRIADQLDTLLTRINACNHRLDAIPELIKRFRHAVLDAATSGALTLDWREQQQDIAPAVTNATGFDVEETHVLPAGWRWERFGSFLSSFRSGTSVVPGNAQTAFPVLRSSSVRPMRIDFEDVRYFSDPSRVRQEDLLVEGDLLFTRLSGSLEYVANCSVVRGLGSRRIYYPDRLFRAKLTRPEQGSYFELCFASPSLRKRLTVEAKSTAGHQRISMGAVTNFPIPLPSAEEQEEIVRRVNALFKLADGIEVRHSVGSLQAQRLIPLVLAKAFRGDLLPQDPSDEPASALLAKIGPSRGGALLIPKIRKTRAPRAVRTPKDSATMTKSRQDDEVRGKPYLAGHLRRLGEPVSVQTLFKASELSVADFYKQLAWEVAQDLVKDNTTTLEPGHAAG